MGRIGVYRSSDQEQSRRRNPLLVVCRLGVLLALLLVTVLPLSAHAANEGQVAPTHESSTPTSELPSVMLSFGTGMSPFEQPFGWLPGSVNTRFGYFVIPELAIDGGIDVLRVGASSGDDDDDFLDEGYTVLTLHAGVKYYFTERTKGSVGVYNQASIFTLIPIVESESVTVDEVASDSFSVGFLEAVGAEYFIDDSFSIGAEFGLNVFIVGYDKDNFEFRGHIVDFYTGFSVNFFL